MKSKILLFLAAIAFKTFFSFLIGLLFTWNVIGYTEFISHTSNLTIPFILYLTICEAFNVLLIKKLSSILFNIPNTKIKHYIIWLSTYFICFFCIDFFFTIEIHSPKSLHHIICGILIASRYIIIFFIVAPSTLKFDPNQAPIIQKEIFNLGRLENKLISKKLFILFSALIYSKYKNILFIALLILVNIASLKFYTQDFVLYLIALILIPFVFYSLFIQIRQITVILKFYKQFSIATGIKL